MSWVSSAASCSPFVGRQVEEADGELTAEEQLAYEKFIHEHEAAAQSTGKGE